MRSNILSSISEKIFKGASALWIPKNILMLWVPKSFWYLGGGRVAPINLVSSLVSSLSEDSDNLGPQWTEKPWREVKCRCAGVMEEQSPVPKTRVMECTLARASLARMQGKCAEL